MHTCFIFLSLQKGISMLKSRNVGGFFSPSFTFWLTFFYPGIKKLPRVSFSLYGVVHSAHSVQ